MATSKAGILYPFHRKGNWSWEHSCNCQVMELVLKLRSTGLQGPLTRGSLTFNCQGSMNWAMPLWWEVWDTSEMTGTGDQTSAGWNQVLDITLLGELWSVCGFQAGNFQQWSLELESPALGLDFSSQPLLMGSPVCSCFQTADYKPLLL